MSTISQNVNKVTAQTTTQNSPTTQASSQTQAAGTGNNTSTANNTSSTDTSKQKDPSIFNDPKEVVDNVITGDVIKLVQDKYKKNGSQSVDIEHNNLKINFDGENLIITGDTNQDGTVDKNDSMILSDRASGDRKASSDWQITDEDNVILDVVGDRVIAKNSELLLLGHDNELYASANTQATISVTGLKAGETSKEFAMVDGKNTTVAMFDHVRDSLTPVSFSFDEQGLVAGMDGVGQEVDGSDADVTLNAFVKNGGTLFQGALNQDSINSASVAGSSAAYQRGGINTATVVGGFLSQSGSSKVDARSNRAYGSAGATIGQDSNGGVNYANISDNAFAQQINTDNGTNIGVYKEDPNLLDQSGGQNRLISSDDFSNSILDNAYTTILGRRRSGPEGSGLFRGLQAGNSQGSILSRFLNSQEYAGKNDSIEQKVEKIYKYLLNRASDAEGKKAWVDRVKNGKLTIEHLIENFVNSKEYLSKQPA